MWIIKPNPDGETWQWWHPATGTGSGSPSQAPASAGHALVLLVPAEQVLVTEAQLPGRNRARLLQALPYALEDQLAGDLENHHCALGEAIGPGRYLAAAVDRARMDRWIETLRERALEPAAIAPDSLALPVPPDESSGIVAIDHERALVRIGASRAYAVGRDELGAFLSLEPELRALTVHGAARLDLPGVAVSAAPAAALPELLAEGARRLPLNLLQGAYRPASEKSARALGIWRAAAIAALIAVVLGLIEQGLQYRQLARQVAVLDERAETLLKQAFPETGRVVNPRVQMEQGLDALRGKRGDLGQAGFLYLLGIAGPTLADAAGVTLKALSYRADGLVLDLHAADLARIEQVRQRIRDQSGIAVVLESASTLADGADARLRLEGARG